MPFTAESHPYRPRFSRRRGSLALAGVATLAILAAPSESAPAGLAAAPTAARVATQPNYVPGQPAPMLMERGRLLLAYARQWVC